MNKRAIGLAALAAGALLARFVPAQEASSPAAAEPAPAAAAPAPAASTERGSPPASSSGASSTQAPRPPAASMPPQASRDDVFIPSEEIQADEEVTFPVDI